MCRSVDLFCRLVDWCSPLKEGRVCHARSRSASRVVLEAWTRLKGDERSFSLAPPRSLSVRGQVKSSIPSVCLPARAFRGGCRRCSNEVLVSDAPIRGRLGVVPRVPLFFLLLPKARCSRCSSHDGVLTWSRRAWAGLKGVGDAGDGFGVACSSRAGMTGHGHSGTNRHRRQQLSVP